ncbi:MAG: DUF4342 domain-containing protein [Clostridia bacterium]|nr:DUF4342 domain-containing protein [Clostridia bacterium]
MEITLEKIELVRDRTGVSYKEAKEALEAAEGNVIDAIIAIEEAVDGGATVTRSTGVAAKKDAIVGKMKEVVAKGNVSKIVISRDDKTILNIPLTAGIVGTVIAPWGMIAGIIAAFGTKCKIEFVKDDGSVTDLSGKAEDFVGSAKEKGTAFYENLKDKAPTNFDELKTMGGDALNKAKEKGAEVYGNLREKAPDLPDLDELKSKGEEAFNKAKEKGAEVYGNLKEKAPDLPDLGELKSKGEEAFNKAKDAAGKAKEDLTERFGKAKEEVTDKLEEVVEEAEKAAEETCEKVEEVCEEACEKAEEACEKTADTIDIDAIEKDLAEAEEEIKETIN